ncbi:MAG: NDP-sugar synthase [Gemmatimonadaceae bacterium]
MRDLVILAAGMGTRFGGPKQLEAVGPSGATILDYSIHDARRAGFGKAILVIRREMASAFEKNVIARWRSRFCVEVAFQETDDLPGGLSLSPGRTKQWGTGHALLAASEFVGGPFATLNADDFYGHEAFGQLAAFFDTRLEEAAPAYAVVGFPLGKTLSHSGAVNRAVLHADDQQWLTDIEEVPGIVPREIITGPTYSADAGDNFTSGIGNRCVTGDGRTLAGELPVSMNMWGFTRAIFSQLAAQFGEFLRKFAADPNAEFLLPSAVQSLVRRREAKVKVLRAEGQWSGITHRDDKVAVAAMLRRLTEAGTYPADLWA